MGMRKPHEVSSMCVSSRIVTPVKRHGISLLFRGAMHELWEQVGSAVCYDCDELHAQLCQRCIDI